MSIAQTTQPANRELSPTEKKIAELKAQTARQVAELRSVGIMADLVKGVRDNKNITEEQLYVLAKPFTNMHEQKLRNDPNYVPKKRGAKKHA